MIKTLRCDLELLKEKDFDPLLIMFQEPEAFKYIAPLKDKDESFYRNFLSKKLHEINSKKGFYWLIKDNNSKELMGAINLTPVPNTDKIQIGWQLKSKYHRKGLAYEAAHAAFQYALSETNLDPIYAVFEHGNIASEKIIKKLGFKKLEEHNEANITVETHIFRR